MPARSPAEGLDMKVELSLISPTNAANSISRQQECALCSLSALALARGFHYSTAKRLSRDLAEAAKRKPHAYDYGDAIKCYRSPKAYDASRWNSRDKVSNLEQPLQLFVGR